MFASAAFLALLLIAVLLPVTAGLFYFIGELQKTRPILPYEPRRSVPWNGVDVLMFLGIMFLVEIGCLKIGMYASGIQLPTDRSEFDAAEQSLVLLAHFVATLLTLFVGAAAISMRSGASPSDFGLNLRKAPYDLRCGIVAFVLTAPVVFLVQIALTHVVPYEHPVIDLIGKRPSGAMLVVLTVSTVLIAPVFEELLFRVLLQGWLEKVEQFALEKLHNAARGGTGSNEHSSESSDEETRSSAARIFGLTPGFLPIATSALVFSLMHIGQVAAMVPLFIFAVVLGFLYRQTHRLLPSVTVHFLLNAVSMAMLLGQEIVPGK